MRSKDARRKRMRARVGAKAKCGNQVPKMQIAKMERKAQTQMTDDPIQLPTMKRLWRVKFADSIENPKIASTVLVRGAENISGAMDLALQGEGWRGFRKAYPDADVVAVEYGGIIEN